MKRCGSQPHTPIKQIHYAAIVVATAAPARPATLKPISVANMLPGPGVTRAMANCWRHRRPPAFVYEAMECLGGNGYV